MIAWGNGIDRDAAAGEFQCEGTGCPMQPGFRRRVICLAAIAGHRRDG